MAFEYMHHAWRHPCAAQYPFLSTDACVHDSTGLKGMQLSPEPRPTLSNGCRVACCTVLYCMVLQLGGARAARERQAAAKAISQQGAVGAEGDDEDGVVGAGGASALQVQVAVSGLALPACMND